MEKISWQNLDKEVKNSISCIAKEGKRQGIPVFIIGGTVRDILLKKQNVDLDCVVAGSAILFAQAIAKLNHGELTIHERFGTATIKLKSKISVDFAMARKESYPSPGALPVVKKGNIQADLSRRDFTVNAMAVALHGEKAGYILDMYGGLNDLKHKQIKVLHDRSFQDDPTRILRAIRFEQRFRFVIEPHTMKLLRAAVRLISLFLIE